MAVLYGDGINSLAGVFSTAFADMTREDIDVLFAEAVASNRCVLPRGPNRYYCEVQPKRIRGFNEIVSHSWLIAVCKAVLGADYQIVEIGFDSMSARSALSVHRGTANRSTQARPVLVVGVGPPDARNADHHDLQFTRAHVGTLADRLA